MKPNMSEKKLSEKIQTILDETSFLEFSPLGFGFPHKKTLQRKLAGNPQAITLAESEAQWVLFQDINKV